MAYIALYRKWRPQDFNNLIGQEHIRKTLANAIQQGKVAHAYLFSGSRGTGKTSTAKILAKALNCEHGPTATPCNHCLSCEKINNGSFMDVFEIDAASNRGIDEIRELRETVKFAPVDGRYKVYIIDEVHMLTTEAFNALLKTLEEPPSHVVFILATTEVHKVPITIQSRCQRYDFKRITKEDILARLKEVMASSDLEVEEEALELIAIQSDGGMRDALSILDQCLAFAEGKLTVEEVHKVLGLVGNNCIWQLTDQIIAKQENDILNVLNDLIADGKDFKQILSEFILHLRSLMIYKATGRMINMEVYLEDEQVLKRQAPLLEHAKIVELIQLANETLNNLKWAPQPRIAVETMFLKMCWQKEVSVEATPIYQEQNGNGLQDEQLNYLVGRLQAMEQLVSRLTGEIDQLKSNSKAIGQESVGSNNVKPTKVLSPSEGMGSTRSVGKAEQTNILTALTKLTPVAPKTELKQIISGDKGNTNSDKKLIEVPPDLRFKYNGNMKQLWKNIIKVLNQNKGLVGLARIMGNPYNVEPYQLNENNQFFVNAKTNFIHGRLEQNIKQIEECIAGITGLDIRVILMLKGNVTSPLGASITPEVATNSQANVYNKNMSSHQQEDDGAIAFQDVPHPIMEEEYYENSSSVEPALKDEGEVTVKEDDDALNKAIKMFSTDEYEIIKDDE